MYVEEPSQYILNSIQSCWCSHNTARLQRLAYNFTSVRSLWPAVHPVQKPYWHWTNQHNSSKRQSNRRQRTNITIRSSSKILPRWSYSGKEVSTLNDAGVASLINCTLIIVDMKPTDTFDRATCCRVCLANFCVEHQSAKPSHCTFGPSLSRSIGRALGIFKYLNGNHAGRIRTIEYIIACY